MSVFNRTFDFDGKLAISELSGIHLSSSVFDWLDSIIDFICIGPGNKYVFRKLQLIENSVYSLRYFRGLFKEYHPLSPIFHTILLHLFNWRQFTLCMNCVDIGVIN